MKKLKASFVAVLVTAMLAFIDFSLFLLNKQAFAYLTGTLALYGLIRGGIDFYFWLLRNPQSDAPVQVKTKTPVKKEVHSHAETQPLPVPSVLGDFDFDEFIEKESMRHGN